MRSVNFVSMSLVLATSLVLLGCDDDSSKKKHETSVSVDLPHTPPCSNLALCVDPNGGKKPDDQEDTKKDVNGEESKKDDNADEIKKDDNADETKKDDNADETKKDETLQQDQGNVTDQQDQNGKAVIKEENSQSSEQNQSRDPVTQDEKKEQSKKYCEDLIEQSVGLGLLTSDEGRNLTIEGGAPVFQDQKDLTSTLLGFEPCTAVYASLSK